MKLLNRVYLVKPNIEALPIIELVVEPVDVMLSDDNTINLVEVSDDKILEYDDSNYIDFDFLSDEDEAFVVKDFDNAYNGIEVSFGTSGVYCKHDDIGKTKEVVKNDYVNNLKEFQTLISEIVNFNQIITQAIKN